MKTPTQTPVAAAGRPVLAETRVKESTLRRIGKLASAVMLVTAGVMLGMYASPEVGATLIAAGVHVGVGALTEGHDERHRRDPRALPGMALGLS